ncbi:hypothetical protein ACIBG4_35615 [Nonomuraea sp. NPDC050383]|uniref:hypothetical protein n=1 Tax=Nonomuraea sp. NPDC050383 TaxID=3364362 RepID=UPI003799081C
MRRTVAVSAVALTLATAGCSGLTYNSEDVTRIFTPQNEGANASGKGVHVRNAFLLGGQPGARPATPPAGLPLYAVLVNDRAEPVRLAQVTLQKGGQARLTAPVVVPARGIVGTDRPIGTVTGVADTGSVPMTFSFDAGRGSLRLIVPVEARNGLFATLNPGGPSTPTGPASPAAPGSPGATTSPSPASTP